MDPLGLERPALAPETPKDWSDTVELTVWGPARRVKWPVTVSGINMQWSLGAGPLKRDQANWHSSILSTL